MCVRLSRGCRQLVVGGEGGGTDVDQAARRVLVSICGRSQSLVEIVRLAWLSLFQLEIGSIIDALRVLLQ